MAESIRDKAIHGTLWSFVERFSVQIVQFITTIVMARILLPSDYGLIGMLSVFMSLSQVFIDGGFSSALIQKKNVSQKDYSTVFYINVGISIIAYILLFAIAPLVADYYDQPLLRPILRVYSINLVINSLVAVQKTILTINLDFKTQSKISLLSAIVSGIVGIVLAFSGCGVWALVIQSLVLAVCNVLLTFLYIRWVPLLTFSGDSFSRLFGFGSKLLVASIISSVYDNLYNIVIGKKFSAQELGFYTRARQFPDLISTNISGIIVRVSYPILSRVQEDDIKLINIYKKYIQVSSFIIFPLLMMLTALAKPIILVLLTDKWIDAVPLIQILCFGLMWNCVSTINLSLLKVKGRSELVLKLEVIKKIIAVSILFISLLVNDVIMICYGIVLYSMIGVTINTYYTDKILNYGIISQAKDFGIYLVISVVVLLAVFLIVSYISIPLLSFIVGVIVYFILYIGACYILKTDALSESVDIFKQIIGHKKQ